MSNIFLNKRLPLATAVIGVLSAQVALAQDTPHINLEEMVVELDRQGTKLKTNVVTTKEKSESTETDLRGLLAEEPAIAIGGGNGTSQYFAIRGMGQNSIDLKIDNAYSDSQILYHQGRFMLDPALVKIVSVQKGAGAASAGIGATNGAIVAKTIDANDLLQGSDKNYGFKVNAGYGTNSKSKTYGVQAFGKTDHFDVLVAANRVDEENYKLGKGHLVDGQDTAPYSGLDKRGYLAKIGTTIGNHRLVASHLQEEHIGNRLVREEFALDNSKDSRLTTARQAPAHRKTTLSNSNLEWKARDLGVIGEATANIYLLKNERYSADDSKNGYAGLLAGPTTTTIETHGANLNLDWDAAGLATVKTGINYRHQEIEPNRRLKATDKINITIANPDFNPSLPENNKTNPKTKSKSVPLGADISNPEKTDVGVYVEAIGDIGNVTATAGVRYDHFKFKAMDGKTITNDSVSPSVGLIWQAAPSLSLSANHNYATRSPRLYDALLSHGNRGITTIRDGVKSEKAQNTELGFNFNHMFANNGRLIVNGSYFWQRIDDAVVSPQNRHEPGSGGNFTDAQIKSGLDAIKEIQNKGHITNQGYEVNLAYHQGGFTGKLGIADSDPTFHGVIQSGTDVNPEFAMKIGRTITGSLAYRFAQPNLEIGVRHRNVADSKGSVLSHVTSGVERKGYDATDVFANWKPYGNDKMNVNFAINNIADKHYIPHSQRAGAGLPAAGRDFRVGVNFTY